MAHFDTQIQAISGPVKAAIGWLETIPGVARRTAARLVAEIGTERTRCPRADPLASWAGVAPAPHERAGQRPSGQTRQGHRCVRTTLVHAAHAAARTQGTARRAPYQRLAARRGTSRAILAVAHAMRVRADDRRQRQEPYH